mmetsp:Transcript_61664/g.145022  ORF Transcript_61664/g.145022 Transcript_61664/m.145022 type:complete len:82 (+) Transcript_61664:187-432(+)
MSIMKLRLGFNPFTLLLSVFVGLILVVGYFYLLSFLLQAGSPDQDTRRRLLSTASSHAMLQADVLQGDDATVYSLFEMKTR